MSNIVKVLVFSLWLFVFLVPFSIFVHPDRILYVLARFFALYALVFLSFQIFLGAFMPELGRIFRLNIYLAHVWLGGLVYFLIILHVLLVFLSGRLSLTFNLLPAERPAIILAVFAFLFLNLAILAAFARKKVGAVWQKIHWLNYLVFVLIFIKSIMIGSDIIFFQIKILYFILALMFIVSFYRRFVSRFKKW